MQTHILPAPFTPSALGRWTLYCGLGELIGIGFAAAVAVGFNQLMGEPVTWPQKVVVLSAMVLAGTVEGCATGYLQWRALRPHIPALGLRAWIVALAAPAVVFWVLGMLPSTLIAGQVVAASAPSASPELPAPVWVLAVGFVVFSLIGGAVIGWSQWLVLRRHEGLHLRGTTRWIGANALGWTLGLILIFAAATWPDEQTPVWLIVTSGVVGGLLGGLAVGAVTGLALRRMLTT